MAIVAGPLEDLLHVRGHLCIRVESLRLYYRRVREIGTDELADNECNDQNDYKDLQNLLQHAFFEHIRSFI